MKKNVHYSSGHEESTDELNRCSSFLGTELLLSPCTFLYGCTSDVLTSWTFAHSELVFGGVAVIV